MGLPRHPRTIGKVRQKYFFGCFVATRGLPNRDFLRALCVVPGLHEIVKSYTATNFPTLFLKMFSTGEIVLMVKSHDRKMVSR